MTQMSKGFNGWSAEDTIPFEPEGYALRIHTGKTSRGGLWTSATRVKLERGGHSFVVFSDFNTTILQSNDRCTEKAVASLHAKAMAKIEDIKAQCRKFYEDKALKEAA